MAAGERRPSWLGARSGLCLSGWLPASSMMSVGGNIGSNFSTMRKGKRRRGEEEEEVEEGGGR